MKPIYILLLFVTSLPCLKTFATSVPASTQTVFNDTLISASHVSKTPVTNKKAGLFAKLKNKLLGLVVKSSLKTEGSGNKKKTLGLVSIGLIVLGLGLLALGAGPLFLLLILGGVTTGIVALSMKGGKEEPKAKKSKTAAIIAAIISAGLLLALIIAFAKWQARGH